MPINVMIDIKEVALANGKKRVCVKSWAEGRATPKEALVAAELQLALKGLGKDMPGVESRTVLERDLPGGRTEGGARG